VEVATQQTNLQQQQQLDNAALVRQGSSWNGSGSFPQLLPADQSRPLTSPSGGRKGSFFSEDLANNNNNNSMSKEADRLVLSVLEETGKHVLSFYKSHKLVQFLSLVSAVLWIRIRMIRMFLGLPDPHPDPAPDPSIIKQK
jgi:hypothetical protein